MGALYHVVESDFIFDEEADDVEILMSNVEWNRNEATKHWKKI